LSDRHGSQIFADEDRTSQWWVYFGLSATLSAGLSNMLGIAFLLDAGASLERIAIFGAVACVFAIAFATGMANWIANGHQARLRKAVLALQDRLGGGEHTVPDSHRVWAWFILTSIMAVIGLSMVEPTLRLGLTPLFGLIFLFFGWGSGEPKRPRTMGRAIREIDRGFASEHSEGERGWTGNDDASRQRDDEERKRRGQVKKRRERER